MKSLFNEFQLDTTPQTYYHSYTLTNNKKDYILVMNAMFKINPLMQHLRHTAIVEINHKIFDYLSVKNK